MEPLFVLVRVCQRCLALLLYPVYWLLSLLQTVTPLQALREEILMLSATQLAEKIRSRQMTSEEVVNLFIFRCRRVNPWLNAIVDERYDSAVREARRVDELLATDTRTAEQIERETPLLGVPFTVKESCKVKGMNFAAGCVLRAGTKAECDGEAVELLRQAGAIPLAVTNQSELCVSAETNNLLYGLTKNPYNQARTVGGSSGGEAAIIGSAASVIGIGSDIHGCIRIPAMFAGVFGHKPTPDIISIEGHHPSSEEKQYSRHLTIGPLTRYAEDLPLMLKLMAGDAAPALRLDEKVNISKIKVFYTDDKYEPLGQIPLDDEVKRAIYKAVNHLKHNHGCLTQLVQFEELKLASEISTASLLDANDLADVFNETDPANPKAKPLLLIEVMKSIVGLSKYSTGALHQKLMVETNSLIRQAKIKEYLQAKHVLQHKMKECLGEDGIFLYPTYPTTAHHHHMFLLMTAGSAFSEIFNALELPSTNVPMGLTQKEHLPVGIQVVAAPYQDRLCLAVAKELERVYDGWIPPPPLVSQNFKGCTMGWKPSPSLVS